MTHAASVGRSFLKLGTGEALARLIAFGMTAVLARRLGADVYGSLALATAILLYLTALGDFGVEVLGITDLASGAASLPRILPSLLGARFIMAAVLILLVSVAGLFLMPQPEGALTAAYAFTLGTAALSTHWVHLGLERSGRVGLLRVVAEALTAVLLLVLVRGPADVGSAPVAQLVGQGAGVVLLLRAVPGGLSRLRVAIDPAIVRNYLRRGWPIVAHALLGLAIFNSDLFFLRLFRDSAVVGYYAVAYTLVSFFLNLGVSYAMGLLPVLSRLRELPGDERRLHDSAMAHVFAGAIPVAVGACLLADQGIALLFGAGYAPSALPLAILVWSIPLALIRNVSQCVLIARGRQGDMLRTVAWAAVVNLAGNAALIPRWGMVGAAVATLLAESVRTVLALGYSRTAGLPLPTLGRFWRTLLAGLLMGAVLMTGVLTSLWIALPVGAAVYLGGLAALGGIRFRRGELPYLAV